jgi:hypothetical protein
VVLIFGAQSLLLKNILQEDQMKLLKTLLVLFLFAVNGFAQEDKYKFEETNPVYTETDVKSLIEINNAADITAKRDQLILYIWGKDGFPGAKLPSEIQTGIKDDRYDHMYKMNLERIDKLVIDMDYNMQSVAYLFIPKKNKNKVIIYHQGHRGDFSNGLETIETLVANEYAVLAFAMPLKGMNNKPVVNIPRFGRLKLENHEHLKMLPFPFKYFMEPMAVGLNHVLLNGYTKSYMIGISGGGWTTTLYAAIDTRIIKSFPVAGSFPIYLRSEAKRDWGDYEQTEPHLYRIANYPELYIMGAFGKGRKQYQLLNKYDACCFAGPKYQLYVGPVKAKMKKLGQGEFDVFSDDSHKEHKISKPVMDIVLDELKK